jgi:nitrogen regulatory protein PII
MSENSKIEAVWLTAIVSPEKISRFEEFFIKHKIPYLLQTMGIGTASNDILDYLGIGESDKEVFFTILDKAHAQKLLISMDRQLQLYIPGNGIAYTVPLTAFAGMVALELVCGKKEAQLRQNTTEEKETCAMKESSGYHLIIAVTNRGYVEEVMEAARAASARGGTVIHAIGTGNKHVEQFFGISIAQERDMIFIVSTTRAKNDIMKAIVAQAGKTTQSHAMAFSLPVDDIVGLRMLEDFEEEDGIEEL